MIGIQGNNEYLGDSSSIIIYYSFGDYLEFALIRGIFLKIKIIK